MINYEQIEPALSRYCYYLTRNKHDAEDLSQEVFSKLLIKAKNGLIKDHSLKGLAITTAHNLLVDEKRKKRPIFEGEQKIVEIYPEERKHLNTFIRSIKNDKIRKVIILRYKFDMLYREICDFTGYNMPVVKKCMHDGRKLIMQKYGHN